METSRTPEFKVPESGLCAKHTNFTCVTSLNPHDSHVGAVTHPVLWIRKLRHGKVWILAHNHHSPPTRGAVLWHPPSAQALEPPSAPQ